MCNFLGRLLSWRQLGVVVIALALAAPAMAAQSPAKVVRTLGKPKASGYQIAQGHAYRCKQWVYGKYQGADAVIIQYCVVDKHVAAVLSSRPGPPKA